MTTAPDLAELEQAAADAARAATEARELADHRRRVESAARMRAERDHVGAALDARRDREVRDRLDTAWTSLVEDLAAGAEPLAAWSTFNTTRGEVIAELDALSTGASLAGRRAAHVPARMTPGSPEAPSLADALAEAARRVEGAAYGPAYEATVQRLDTEREAAISAHLATVDLDGPVGDLPVVARFVALTATADAGPWSTEKRRSPEDLTVVGRVAHVHTPRLAQAIQHQVSVPSQTSVAEVDEDTAARVEEFEREAGRLAHIGELMGLIWPEHHAAPPAPGEDPTPSAPTARRRMRRSSVLAD